MTSLSFIVQILILLVPHASGSTDASEAPRYCVTTLRSDFTQSTLDDFGVPIVDYGYFAGVYVGPQRHPITIGHTALSSYDDFVRSNASYSAFKFLRNADWLSTHAQELGNFSVFEFKFPRYYPPATIEPIWRSAMAQGLAVEALTKAYHLTGNSTYLDSAKELLNAFYVEEDEGGVTHKTRDDGWWYELLANAQGVNPRILNGHLFALLGIHEYYNTTSDSSAKYLFDQGITALKNNLPRFDYENGTYSYYDLSSPKKLPSQNYHRLVLDQLDELFEITKDPLIKKYYDKWRNFELPKKIYDAETCRRTAIPPLPVFKLANSDIRIGPSKINNTSESNAPYHVDFSTSARGLNLTSQILSFRALNITLTPQDPKEIVFTINIEEVHKPNVRIQVVFGPPSQQIGWVNENLYVINAGSRESITVDPLEVIGEEYLWVKSMDVFLPGVSYPDSMAFDIKIA